MRRALHPCVSCDRHVRVDEHACPFCGAVQPARSVRLAVGVVVIGALALSGCDLAASASAQDDDSDEAVRQTPQYGAPDYQPDPPPPLPPTTQNRDAGPMPRASS